MTRPMVKDPIFLARKSAPAPLEDLPVARDLLDTLDAYGEGCVGDGGQHDRRRRTRPRKRER